MKIVFYRAEYPQPFNTETFLRKSVGGTEFAAGYLAKELAKRHTVYFLCQTPRKAKIDQIHWIPIAAPHGVPDPAAIQKAIQGVGAVDIFILIGGLSHVLDLGPLPTRKVICWANGLSLKPNTIKHLWENKIDVVVCTTRYAAEKVYANTLHHLPLGARFKHVLAPHWRQAFRAKFTFIYNGVNLQLFSPEIKSKIKKCPAKILYAGVFNEQKNPDKILAVFPQIRKALPQATLHMCGSIEQYKPGGADSTTGYFDGDAFFSRIQESMYLNGQLRPGLYLRGALPPHLLAQEMMSATLVVVNPQVGNQESSCIGALEAQAAGTPVIGGGHSALDETIQHKRTGFVFAEQAQLAAWIIQILKNPGRVEKLGAAGRRRAFQGFGWPTIAHEWEDLLQSLLAQRHYTPKQH